MSSNNRMMWAVYLGLACVTSACAELLGLNEEPPTVAQCVSSVDCPGVDDACGTRTCEGGTCGTAFAGAGKPCNGTGSCDGHGTCKLGNGSPCSLAEQCFSGNCVDGVCCNEVCSEPCRACSGLGEGNNGICKPVPNGGADAECVRGVCNEQAVCEHENGETCSTGENCVSGNCVADVCCAMQCAAGASCATGACVCPGVAGLTCGDVCVDAVDDNAHCGGCGNTCDTTNQSDCRDGSCQGTTWALWPMPNPVGTGLPNLADYEIREADGVVIDKVTGLMWKREVEEGSFPWDDAKTHCNEMTYAGFTDWRLPTRIELVSLVDFSRAAPGPTIDTNAFPAALGEVFWTSSVWLKDPAFAWFVSFISGNSDIFKGTNAYRVRCVR